MIYFIDSSQLLHIDEPFQQRAYKFGKSCSNCGPTAKCVKGGLCSCPMRGINLNYCGKYGSFDTTTCKCKCDSYASGKQCQNLKCPKKDKYFCVKHVKPSMCGWGVKGKTGREHCPYMCGICTSESIVSECEKELHTILQKSLPTPRAFINQFTNH